MVNAFLSGSPVVVATLWLLVVLSVATWSIALLKIWKQWKSGTKDRAFNLAFWSAQDWQNAAKAAAAGEGDLARLSQAGFAELSHIQAASAGTRMESPQETLERTLRQTLQNIQRYEEGGLATLASIGSTAPFVGLFGTVWGIMHALQDIGNSGRAGLDVVAGPIGDALITTAVGIATALPAVAAYNYFARRQRVRMTALGNFVHDYVRLAARHHFDA